MLKFSEAFDVLVLYLCLMQEPCHASHLVYRGQCITVSSMLSLSCERYQIKTDPEPLYCLAFIYAAAYIPNWLHNYLFAGRD